MILDKLENASLYSGSSPRLAEAFRWLQTENLAALEEGTTTIREGELRAIVQKYETVPEAGRKLEGHRRFIDIQYIVSGRERMLVAPSEPLQPDVPYDEETDLEFFLPADRPSELIVEESMFAVFYPQDAHMPMLSVGADGSEASRVTKIVMKVAV
jgi:YhcH/YjgK/YiaL family protein